MIETIKEKILIVDDDAGIREMLAINFADQYDVDTAGGAEEVTKKLETTKYLLVITDMKMPGGSGLDVIRSVKNKSPLTLVMVMTGYGSVEDAVNAVRLGAEEYVLKPFSLERVNMTVKNIVEKFHLSRQLNKIERLFELEKVSRAVLESEIIEKSLPDILKMILGMFKADSGSVMLFDKNTNQLMVSASEGIAPKFHDSIKVSSGDKISGWAARYNRALLLDGDSEKSKKIFGNFKPRSEIKSSLVVPLTIRGKLLGVLNLNMLSTLKKFTDEDLDIITIFSMSLALSIENARFKRELIENNERLKEIDIVKTDLVSKVSHELRTPLTVIMEAVKIVSDGSCGELNEEQKDYLGVAVNNVERLGRLINDVLFIQKLEAGMLKFNLQENNINELVVKILEPMRPIAGKKGLALELIIGEDIPKIKYDSDKITQVIINLVDNALKFTETGKITVKTVKEGDIVKVSVADTGIGIKQGDTPKLFGKFEQILTGNERRTGGTGLGLSICREIITGHNGKIWAESEWGKGTKFYFTLPAEEKGVL
ncbi:MAG: ATP-binding protein [Candidatus Firestonebacteria bacterium]|nr:ATP-binding protein [Candidatus Firestonebacteria bacterium]